MTKSETLLKTPAYPFVEAARYLHISDAALRAWCLGGRGFWPIIRRDGKLVQALSFLNVIEAHVLSSIREQRIPPHKVRKALLQVGKCFDVDRPLVEARFATQGVELFVEVLGHMLKMPSGRRDEIAKLIGRHLHRIDRDAHGVPVRLYPFTRRGPNNEAIRSVVMDPRIAFGRPVLTGTGIPTSVLADRFKAGDSLTDLAEDFGVQPEAVEEAIRCEFGHCQPAWARLPPRTSTVVQQSRE